MVSLVLMSPEFLARCGVRHAKFNQGTPAPRPPRVPQGLLRDRRRRRGCRAVAAVLRPRARRRESLRHHRARVRSEEHTSELQSLMRISYAVFCLQKKIKYITMKNHH